MKFPFAARKMVAKKKRRAGVLVIQNRGLQTNYFQTRVFHSSIFWHHSAHFFQDFEGMRVTPEAAGLNSQPFFQTSGEVADDFPIGTSLANGLDGFADPLDAPVSVGKGAIFFGPGSSRQKYVRK